MTTQNDNNKKKHRTAPPREAGPAGDGTPPADAIKIITMAAGRNIDFNGAAFAQAEGSAKQSSKQFDKDGRSAPAKTGTGVSRCLTVR